MGAEVEAKVVCPVCKGRGRFTGDEGPWRQPKGIPCDECSGSGRVPARLVDPEAVLRTMLEKRLAELDDGELDKAASCFAWMRRNLLNGIPITEGAETLLSVLAPASPEEGTDAK